MEVNYSTIHKSNYPLTNGKCAETCIILMTTKPNKNKKGAVFCYLSPKLLYIGYALVIIKTLIAPIKLLQAKHKDEKSSKDTAKNIEIKLAIIQKEKILIC